MGKLTFSDLQIEVPAPTMPGAGRWYVAFADGKAANGLFTLVFRRLPEGWRIVHDHTSEAENRYPRPIDGGSRCRNSHPILPSF
jgi:beta-aspartyl-peptidase (threonine type)